MQPPTLVPHIQLEEFSTPRTLVKVQSFQLVTPWPEWGMAADAIQVAESRNRDVLRGVMQVWQALDYLAGMACNADQE